MAKESTIRTHCINNLLDQGWITWCPTRNRFGAGRTTWLEDGEKMGRSGDDILTIVDLIAFKGNTQRWIQYTSLGNVSARRHKVEEILKKHDLEIEVEVWGHVKGKEFRYWIHDKEWQECDII